MPRSSLTTGNPHQWRRVVGKWTIIALVSLCFLYLIRIIECRAKLPDSRVVALVYQQSTDSFSVITEPIPWWSARGLRDHIELQTITPKGMTEGLYPHPSYRKREVVDYPDPTLDAYFPGYVLSNDLPKGKAYSPTQPWKMAQGISQTDGQWGLEYEIVHLNDTDITNPILVNQYSNNPTGKSPGEYGYVFHINAMGGIASRGLGPKDESSIKDRLRHAISDFLVPFE